MKKLFLILGILFVSQLNGQNYFTNPGFENYSQCPTYTSQITYCTGMEDAIGTSDFYNCGYVAPSTIGNYGIPSSGNGCIGFIVSPPSLSNGQRWYGETMKTSLSQALVPGSTYQISAEILCNPIYGPSPNLPCYDIGFLFYKSSNNDTFPQLECLGRTPQIKFSANSILNSYSNFTSTFIADSCYDKVMIGLFCNNLTLDSSCQIIADVDYYDLDNIAMYKIADAPTFTNDFNASKNKICKDDCLEFFITGNTKNYSWSWTFNGSQTASSTQEFPTSICYPQAGLFDVTLLTNYECGSDTIFKPSYIEVKEKPEIYIEDNTELVCTGIEIELNAISNSTVKWNTGFRGNNLMVSQSGTYIAFAENQCGIASDTIIKQFENCNCNLFLPKAFSPNGDLKNESFKVYHECVLKSFSLSIRNRWGQELFKTNDPNQTWNGMYNGHACPTDVYVALVEYTGYEDGIIKSYSSYSTVTLLY